MGVKIVVSKRMQAAYVVEGLDDDRSGQVTSGTRLMPRPVLGRELSSAL